MPPGMAAKSYSLRSSSRPRLRVFFIELAFRSRCSPCADDSDVIVALGVSNEQEPTTGRGSDCDVSLLVLGMIYVRKRGRERIAQDCGCFAKSDAVLLRICSCLLGIPPKIHPVNHRMPSESQRDAMPFPRG